MRGGGGGSDGGGGGRLVFLTPLQRSQTVRRLPRTATTLTLTAALLCGGVAVSVVVVSVLAAASRACFGALTRVHSLEND